MVLLIILIIIAVIAFIVPCTSTYWMTMAIQSESLS